MSKSLLYNYSARVIEVQSPNTIIALVDHGFRSWSMRQFRIPGVSSPDPRSVPRGPERDAMRSRIDTYASVLSSVLASAPKTGILVCPEKPSFSGHFSADVYMVASEPQPDYCLKFHGTTWFDIPKLMRDLCAERISVSVAKSFIASVKPVEFAP